MNLKISYWCAGMMFIGYCSEASAASELWLKRYAYDAIQQSFNKNDISVYQKKRSSIQDYPLAAYTDYRAFLFNIADKTPEQVNQFSERYFAYPFSNLVRVNYLNALIATKNWSAMTEYQTVLPRDQNYQCWYYTAHFHQGNTQHAFDGARSLWLNGKNISSACNDLFSYWNEAGDRTDIDILNRALLAIESRNPNLINYLNNLIANPQNKKILSEMQRLYKKPDDLIAVFANKKDSAFNQKYAQTMLKRLGRKNIKKAFAAHQFLLTHFAFDQEQFQTCLEYVAVRLFESKNAEVIKWRDEIINKSSNDDVLEQRIRLSIRRGNWQQIQYWISKLSAKQQATHRWQYWLARSESALGQVEKGKNRLESISGDRRFYSVLAAIALDKEINFPISSVEIDNQRLAIYKDDLARIHELLFLSKLGAAKSQWRHLIERVPTTDKAQLTAYAKKQKWYAFAHDAALSEELKDYIELRFPVRYYNLFEYHGNKNKVDVISLLSLARQESSFQPLSQSPVGALGIMQVMPSTAKYVAEKYKINYQKSAELFKPDKNIEIGCHYLSHLLNHYGQNRVFAYAAYNAGPTMVKVWRQRASSNIDIFAYIEGISFKETRVYVKNILMFEMYYRKIMQREGSFFTKEELNWQRK